MSRTIVLVEDHPYVRELYAIALRDAGWRVLERASAHGLRQLVLHEHIEVVIIDETLPGGSGLSTLRALKHDPKTRHVRVLVLTAHGSSALREAALAAGAEQFLQKPLRPDALLAALDPCYSAAHVASPLGSLP
jgi:two-component system phosphate regulon response regulator PhoB